MITRQETMQSQTDAQQQKKQSKFSAWRGLFRVLDKLSLKKQLTRFFIFHPPKPTYNFVTSGLQDPGSDPVWEFKAGNMGKLNSNPYIKANAYKLYREKVDKTYMTPLIWLLNERSKSEYVVLYSHGNSSDLGTAYSSAVTFSIVFKMSVVVYDYTGYGLSPHKPSEKNLYDDIETVLSFIVTFLDYPLNKIILVGFSLGSGPTVEMAARYKSIPFMILLAPLASCLAMVEGDGVTEKSNHDMFANFDKIPDVACDIIFVHGLNDSVIPSSHSTKMFQRYVETHSAPKNNVWLLEVEDTDHHQLVQELADLKTEFSGLFMHYFDFLLENNHTIFNEQEAKLGMEWENEMRNTIEKVRRKTNVTTSADGVEEHKASFKETGLINKVLFSDDNFENDFKEESDIPDEREEEVEEKKEEEPPVLQDTRLDLRLMTQSCFKRTVIMEETLKLRNVFKKITVNKPATKRKNSRKMYEEQLKSIKVFL